MEKLFNPFEDGLFYFSEDLGTVDPGSGMNFSLYTQLRSRKRSRRTNHMAGYMQVRGEVGWGNIGKEIRQPISLYRQFHMKDILEKYRFIYKKGLDCFMRSVAVPWWSNPKIQKF